MYIVDNVMALPLFSSSIKNHYYSSILSILSGFKYYAYCRDATDQ
jgi:hypothetical protein